MAERARRRACLAWVREHAPDVWRLSYEVDLSLVLWMRSLSPSERIACIENFNSFIEVARIRGDRGIRGTPGD